MSRLAQLRTRLSRRLRVDRFHTAHFHDDRGDVPGWVLVAVMTAGLVTAIWILADHQLTSVFNRAISAIAGP
ncbi:MAG: hypothetical protein ORN20_04035 [Candidatus Nanopelagicales bacterium]|jgi:hypothetical protein|nr:hypothetical protein [Candidatus Nanopelagicales bacterium]